MDTSEFLMHHGVKGMKWGIRRRRFTTDKHGGRQNRFGGKLSYTSESWNGNEKQRSVRVNAIDRAILKKTGAVNRDGTVTTPEQQASARRYAQGKKAVLATRNVAIVALGGILAGKMVREEMKKRNGNNRQN